MQIKVPNRPCFWTLGETEVSLGARTFGELANSSAWPWSGAHAGLCCEMILETTTMLPHTSMCILATLHASSPLHMQPEESSLNGIRDSTWSKSESTGFTICCSTIIMLLYCIVALQQVNEASKSHLMCACSLVGLSLYLYPVQQLVSLNAWCKCYILELSALLAKVWASSALGCCPVQQ